MARHFRDILKYKEYVLKVMRAGEEVDYLPYDETATFTKGLMGEHAITVNSIVPHVLDIQIGDYIICKGETFKLNTVPNVVKNNAYQFTYSLVFEGVLYSLYDKLIMFEGKIDFPMYGTPRDYLNLIVENMNQIDDGWSVGFVEEVSEKHFSFSNDSCRVALTKTAELFGLEFALEGKQISMSYLAGVETNLDFHYGRGRGLYSIGREYVEENNVVTRVYGFGGSRNLPLNYDNNRLTLPEGFIEANTNLYGTKEQAFTNDDIFPSRTGTATSVSSYNIEKQTFTLTDTSIDFDLNEYFLDTDASKISFKTGMLTGYEFEIVRYDHVSKTITYKSDVQNGGETVLPNSDLFAAVGDEYVLLDIKMPDEYVSAAVSALRSKTLEFLNENKIPRVLYSVNFDPLYLRANGIRPDAGDRVRVKDEQLGIDDKIRISSISYPLRFFLNDLPNVNIRASIANFIPYTIQERNIKDSVENKTAIRIVDRRSAEKARRNSRNFRQLQNLILDPDDYFNTERIKPLSIETGMLSVGAKSQNFGLNGVEIDANTGGDPNHLTISSGGLVHFEVEIEGLGYVWQMAPGDFPDLDPEKSYYLSAKVKNHALEGEWNLSNTFIKTEAEAGFWHFNLGILYAVSDNSRSFDFTNGMTFIVGDRITTGRIQSLDGLNYFDLSSGQFKLGDEENGIDWNVTSPGQLTIGNAIASSIVKVGSGGFISAGLSGLNDVPLDGAGMPKFSAPVRIWAGESEVNKYNSKFMVLNDGTLIALKGKIADFTINGDRLEAGEPWKLRDDFVTLGPGDLIFRHVGDTADQKIEMSFGYAGLGAYSGLRLTNTIQAGYLPENVALSLEAKNGINASIALDIVDGDIRVKGHTAQTFEADIGSEGWYLKFVDGLFVGAFFRN